MTAPTTTTTSESAPRSTAVWPTSALDAAGAAFAALTCDPAPLRLDCDALGSRLGLPSGKVSLAVLRDWMLSHPRAYGARDAVWREVIARARGGAAEWVIAAAGLALPALIAHARRLAVGYRGDPDDLDAEVLAGFLEALRSGVDLCRPAPYARLVRSAWRAGHAAKAAEHRHLPVSDLDSIPHSRPPGLPYNHPDLLVHRAVEIGLLDAEDAVAWIEVRLDRRPLERIARVLGVSPDALRMRLRRADTALADALADGHLSGLVSRQAREEIATRARQRDRARSAKPRQRQATSAVVNRSPRVA